MLCRFCLSVALVSASGIVPLAASAQTENQAVPSAPAGRDVVSTAGVVRKVDKEAGKVTIRHEPLRNLDMPAMTMVFRVKDPVMLEQLKPGDKISFVAEKVEGNYTVMRFEPAK